MFPLLFEPEELVCFLFPLFWFVIRLCGFFFLPLSPGYALPTHCMRFQSLRKSHLLFQNYLCCLEALPATLHNLPLYSRSHLPVRPLRSELNASFIRRLAQICHRYGQFGRNAVHFFPCVAFGSFRIPSAAFSASVKAFLTSFRCSHSCPGLEESHCPLRSAFSVVLVSARIVKPDCITQSLLRRLYLHLESIFVVY